MKKFSILASLLLFFIASEAYAQGGRGQGRQRQSPEEMAQNRADTFQEEFGLSDEQHGKVYDLLLKSQKETREKMAELRESGDREAMMAAFEEAQEEMEKELKTILSAKQWTAYEKWKEENPQNFRRRRGGGE